MVRRLARTWSDRVASHRPQVIPEGNRPFSKASTAGEWVEDLAFRIIRPMSAASSATLVGSGQRRARVSNPSTSSALLYSARILRSVRFDSRRLQLSLGGGCPLIDPTFHPEDARSGTLYELQLGVMAGLLACQMRRDPVTNQNNVRIIALEGRRRLLQINDSVPPYAAERLPINSRAQPKISPGPGRDRSLE